MAVITAAPAAPTHARRQAATQHYTKTQSNTHPDANTNDNTNTNSNNTDHSTHRPLVDFYPPLKLLLRQPPVELPQKHLLGRPAVAPLHRFEGGGIQVKGSRHLYQIREKTTENKGIGDDKARGASGERRWEIYGREKAAERGRKTTKPGERGREPGERGRGKSGEREQENQRSGGGTTAETGTECPGNRDVKIRGSGTTIQIRRMGVGGTKRLHTGESGNKDGKKKTRGARMVKPGERERKH